MCSSRWIALALSVCGALSISACGGRAFEEQCSLECAATEPPSGEFDADGIATDRNSQELVFVSNERSSYLSVIDAERDRVLRAIATRGQPRSLSMSASGRELFVALGADSNGTNACRLNDCGIAVIDVKQRALTRVLASTTPMDDLAATPNGRRLIALNRAESLLSVIELENGTVSRTITLPAPPTAIAIHPDGRFAYVAIPEAREILVLDLATYDASRRIPTSDAPQTIAFTANGDEAFITNRNASRLTVIDVRRHEPSATIDLDAARRGDIEPRPMTVLMAKDSARAYVTMGRNGGIAVLDIAAKRIIDTLDAVGPRPFGIALTHDGEKLFVANGASNDVSVVRVANGAVLKRLEVGSLPSGITISHYGSEVQHASTSSP